LRQEHVDPSLLDKALDPERDRWEFEAVREALARGLPIFAICKGLQVFNVALGGTLKLDIKGHNLPEQRDREVQALRHARRVSHRFSKVNSAHHQAIDRLADGCEVEAWSAHDGIIEQIFCGNIHSLAVCNIIPSAVPFMGRSFEDFFARLKSLKH
jgi:putative glutamine amidotransferase